MTEVYKLDCHACGRTIILPPRDGEQVCPLCGTPLFIQWNAERQPKHCENCGPAASKPGEASEHHKEAQQ